MSWESMKTSAFLHLSMWLLALGLHDKPHRLSGEFVQSASIDPGPTARIGLRF